MFKTIIAWATLAMLVSAGNFTTPVAGFMINAHTIGKASLISYYGR